MKKKKILAVIIAAMFTGMIAGCGNQDTKEVGQDVSEQNEDTEEQNETAEELIYLADIKAEDYVDLGEYKGVEVEVSEPEVTDEEVDEYIEYMLSIHAETAPITDRSVKTGDVANIDFEGKLDGEVFEGGSAKEFDLVIGSGSFIPGFEDGVIGMEIGETKDIELNFPDPYQKNPDLSGKEVVFTVTLNGINEQIIPELTDEYVAGLGIENCSTVEDYRKFIHDGLMEQVQAAYEEEKTGATIAVVEANTTFKEPPEGIVNRMNEILFSNADSYAQMYGMSLEDYVVAAYGGTTDEYEDKLMEEAGKMAQRYIMIAAIADREKIAITDEELDEILAEEAKSLRYDSVEEYKADIDVESYREYLLVQEVIEFLTDNAVTADSASE